VDHRSADPIVRGAVLGLVPARGGSKGVPGKNTRLLAGRPLLEYTARAARGSGVLDRIVLSTDAEEIAACGRRVGLEVPFMRPASLAQDDTPMLPVVEHALDELRRQGWEPAVVVLLQPTSPLRTPAHIRAAVEQVQQTGADSVVSVVAVPQHLSPDYVMRLDAGRLRPFLPDGARVTRRQDARPAFVRDGTVYAFRTDTLRRFGTIYGDDCRPLVLDADESLSIDTAADWAAAERALEHLAAPGGRDAASPRGRDGDSGMKPA
jgi:CMP-N-acetylneuraminic acid synthetase